MMSVAVSPLPTSAIPEERPFNRDALKRYAGPSNVRRFRFPLDPNVAHVETGMHTCSSSFSQCSCTRSATFGNPWPGGSDSLSDASQRGKA
jgi:hypothetical protein